jgi:hypothetical protein
MAIAQMQHDTGPTSDLRSDIECSGQTGLNRTFAPWSNCDAVKKWKTGLKIVSVVVAAAGRKNFFVFFALCGLTRPQ